MELAVQRNKSSQSSQKFFEMEAPLLASDKTSGRAPFPHDFEEFTNDDRVSYSQLDGCWILEEADGSVWEFNERLKKWMLMVRSKPMGALADEPYLSEGILI